MSYYRDNRTTITPNQVKIKGVPFPIISNLIIERSSIKSIELQQQGILERLVANGPTARDTWSCYDPLAVSDVRQSYLTCRSRFLVSVGSP